MSKLNYLKHLLWVVCALPLLVMAQANAPVGLVVDLKGPVTATDQGKNVRIEVMGYLRPQMEIDVGAGGMLAVTLYANSSESRFNGPAKLKVLADRVQVLQGAAAQQRSLNEAPVSAAKRVVSTRLTQAAVMMRSVKPASEGPALVPVSGSRIMILNPVFSWPVPDTAAGPSRFELRRASGELLYQGTANGGTLQLPAANTLEWGQSYRWRVQSETSPSARVEGRFEVITREKLMELAERRPPNDGPFADWVLFAAMLDDLSLTAEATEVWKWLAVQRPDDENLKRLANR